MTQHVTLCDWFLLFTMVRSILSTLLIHHRLPACFFLRLSSGPLCTRKAIYLSTTLECPAILTVVNVCVRALLQLKIPLFSGKYLGCGTAVCVCFFKQSVTLFFQSDCSIFAFLPDMYNLANIQQRVSANDSCHCKWPSLLLNLLQQSPFAVHCAMPTYMAPSAHARQTLDSVLRAFSCLGTFLQNTGQENRTPCALQEGRAMVSVWFTSPESPLTTRTADVTVPARTAARVFTLIDKQGGTGKQNRHNPIAVPPGAFLLKTHRSEVLPEARRKAGATAGILASV